MANEGNSPEPKRIDPDTLDKLRIAVVSMQAHDQRVKDMERLAESCRQQVELCREIASHSRREVSRLIMQVDRELGTNIRLGGDTWDFDTGEIVAAARQPVPPT